MAADRAEVDEDALAEAYNRALALEKAGELEAASRAYREVLALDPADRGGASVRLASMGQGPHPEKAPDAYVETLFDQHAEVFDNVLVEQLGYAVPVQLRQLLSDLALGPFDRVLDLGCGTGLTGGELRGMAGYIAGVDISENMVELADEREVYDALYVGEALAFLKSGNDEEERWDLIAATDVMPYLGDLTAFIGEMAAALTSDGWIAFSTETLPDEVMAGRDYMVGPYQRFAHREDYVRRLLAGNQLEVEAFEPITVRHEQGAPIAGHLVLARRKGR
ncbi:MAG: methyltransferase domain-containing protein [Rhizobiaceae bacterium]